MIEGGLFLDRVVLSPYTSFAKPKKSQHGQNAERDPTQHHQFYKVHDPSAPGEGESTDGIIGKKGCLGNGANSFAKSATVGSKTRDLSLFYKGLKPHCRIHNAR